jgi:hypothetical protein
VRAHQVPLERGHFPLALETDRVIGEDRHPGSDRRRWRSGLAGRSRVARRQTLQGPADVADQSRDNGRGGVVADTRAVTISAVRARIRSEPGTNAAFEPVRHARQWLSLALLASGRCPKLGTCGNRACSLSSRE